MERLSPAVWSWRSQAALALVALDRRPEAAQLAAEEVELAERSGSAWAEGLALHAAGVIARRCAGCRHCSSEPPSACRAWTRLRSTPACSSTWGRWRIAAGASREQAIDWLRRGLDLADRCDASLLAQRAHAALFAHGARPRRRRLSGAEALTPMERRVAERAASRNVQSRDRARPLPEPANGGVAPDQRATASSRSTRAPTWRVPSQTHRGHRKMGQEAIPNCSKLGCNDLQKVVISRHAANGANGIRTRDLLLAKQALSQLSYGPDSRASLGA